VLLHIVKFVLRLINGVVCVDVYIVHMQVVPTDFITVIFLRSIQMSAPPPCPCNSHSICYYSLCMLCLFIWFEYQEMPLLFLMA
jgi:hypothetical protein